VTDLGDISVGRTLAAARKKKRLRYKKLSSELNIEESYLIALEEDNFELIPGGEAYVKGFLRSYAKKLDLNPDEIIQIYSSEREKNSDKTSSDLNLQLKKDNINQTKYLAALILVPALVVVFFLSLAFILGFPTNQKEKNLESFKEDDSIQLPEKFEDQTIEIPTTQIEDLDKITFKLDDSPEESDKDLRELPPSKLDELPKPVISNQNITSIRVFDDCWLEVFSEKERLIYILAKAGEEYIFEEDRLKIIAGNFKNIEISFNDKIQDLEYYANKINVSCIVLPTGSCSEFRTPNS
jgi:cytoskeletal protein RodZ